MAELDFAALRRQMVAQIAAQTIFLTARTGQEPRWIGACWTCLGQVPRHEFVRLELQPLAYADMPLPSGYDKTISQPFIVALMTDLLNLKPTDSVLEIGTGLGYQAAILARAGARNVYSVEIIEELALEDAPAAGSSGLRQRRLCGSGTAAAAGRSRHRSTRSSSRAATRPGSGDAAVPSSSPAARW